MKILTAPFVDAARFDSPVTVIMYKRVLWDGILTLTLCWYLVLWSRVDACSNKICGHVVNSTADLHFLKEVDGNVFSKPGWLSLNCCADGFTDIAWHYHTTTNTTWRAWPWFKPCLYCGIDIPPYRKLCHQNQTIQFLSAIPADSGSYRCNVSNSVTGRWIIRTQHLVVELCENRSEKGMQFVEEPDSLKQRAVPGGNVSFICAGDFGCPTDDPVRQANWSFTDKSGMTYDLRPGQGHHYIISYNRSFPEIIIKSTLTIVGVEDSDYDLTFTCQLLTSKFNRKYNLVLHRPESTVKLNIRVIIIAVCSVGGATLLLGVSLSIYCCYKPSIDFSRRRMMGTLPAREAGQEDFYDGCIIHSRDNTNFVKEEIRKRLLDEDYNIFTQECVSEGENEISSTTDNIGKSMCAILVLSRAEIEDSDAINFLFSVAVASCGSNMVVIEKDDIEESSWRSAIKGGEALQYLPKMLKTVQWKGRGIMSRRQIKNFFASIKLNLPAPCPTKSPTSKDLKPNPRGLSDSSTAPLISEQNMSASDFPSVYSESGNSRQSSKGSASKDAADFHNLKKLSSSNCRESDTEDNVDDEVFVSNKLTHNIPKHPKSPSKQMSCDSGIATSI